MGVVSGALRQVLAVQHAVAQHHIRVSNSGVLPHGRTPLFALRLGGLPGIDATSPAARRREGNSGQADRRWRGGHRSRHRRSHAMAERQQEQLSLECDARVRPEFVECCQASCGAWRRDQGEVTSTTDDPTGLLGFRDRMCRFPEPGRRSRAMERLSIQPATRVSGLTWHIPAQIWIRLAHTKPWPYRANRGGW